jgi:hypothetical protein
LTTRGNAPSGRQFRWIKFLHEEDAQDLMEYTLPLAFDMLVGAALLITAGQSTSRCFEHLAGPAEPRRPAKRSGIAPGPRKRTQRFICVDAARGGEF